ncbi:MAG: Protein of unknown function (DUF1192) [Rhodobacteraceae bacterium HLUCCA08]|nr:MAG: Protein of unknown function (DUF1192) [Rhodobacteraceae bacterium HLUCCA08]
MNLDFRFYWSLFLRRLPVMALFVILCSGAGFVAATRLPDTWSTAARLLVEAPQIPDSMVRSTVQTDAVEQLDIIEQRLLTRANLIDIAHDYGVFENISDMEPDQVVAAMRQATSIRRTAGRNQATLMTISFEARTGEIAAEVVNRYVTLVLEANAESRIGRAEETLSFFEQEVGELSSELNRRSADIAAFRSENADALPEDHTQRLNRQTLLTERLVGYERELRSIEAQREELISTYESTGRVRPTQSQGPGSAEEQQLIVARAELELLLSQYSEENYRVIQKRSLIERLEAIVAAQTSAGMPTDGGDAATPDEVFYEVTLNQIDTRLEALRDEIARTETELAALQAQIQRSAGNERELADMQREYDIALTRYNAAVANLNQAQMSERIETTARGQRITVIENANIPRIPSGPDRPQIAILGTGFGIALAGGYFALLEFLNRSIRRPAELASRFQITPITAIPYMESRGRRMLRRVGLVGAMVAVVVGVPAALWYIDTNYVPIELIVERGLSTLGLG